MKMINNLSMNIVKQNVGFERREDLDFSDDGNRFRGYEYRGLPITTLRSDNVTYLQIREDYMDNAFTHNEWRKTDEYNLCYKYNGVSDFDLYELIRDCQKILAKIDEMNAAAENETVDLMPLKAQVMKEITLIEDICAEAKKTIAWWDLSSNDFYHVKNAMDRLQGWRRLLIDIFNGKVTAKQLKQHREHMDMFGCVLIRENNDFSIKELRKYIHAENRG